jgi:hypothetical protein
VTFVPPSSFFAGSVTGTVSVSNFPADQLVHFAQPVTVDVDNFPADQLVHFATPIAVTGPLTDAQLAARLPLSVSGPVTVASLPLPDGAATEATLKRVQRASDDVAFVAITEDAED